MKDALDTVTTADMRGWFAHCGYPVHCYKDRSRCSSLIRDNANFQVARNNVTRTLGRSPHGSGTWLTTGDLRRKHVAYDDRTTPGTTRGHEIVPALEHLAKVAPCATSSYLRSRASYLTVRPNLEVNPRLR
jgi:hypothetical protein